MPRGRKVTPIRERFESKYCPEPNSGCWLWVYQCDKNGYGILKGNGGRPKKAHRLAYEFYRGPVPRGMCVCHKCDTPSCVNPDHLFVGTNLDNVRDMFNKGRANKSRGDRHGSKTHPEKFPGGNMKAHKGQRVGVDGQWRVD